MTKVLFFDLDGTLTDTHALHIATRFGVLPRPRAARERRADGSGLEEGT